MDRYEPTYIDRVPVSQEIQLVDSRSLSMTKAGLRFVSGFKSASFLASCWFFVSSNYGSGVMTLGALAVGVATTEITSNRFRNKFYRNLHKGQLQLSQDSIQGIDFTDQQFQIVNVDKLAKLAFSNPEKAAHVELFNNNNGMMKVSRTSNGIGLAVTEQTSPLEMWDDALDKILTPSEDAAFRDYFENRVDVKALREQEAVARLKQRNAEDEEYEYGMLHGFWDDDIHDQYLDIQEARNNELTQRESVIGMQKNIDKIQKDPKLVDDYEQRIKLAKKKAKLAQEQITLMEQKNRDLKRHMTI